VSAYRLDEALGFGRVPPTGRVQGPFGPGSNQQWVFSSLAYPALVRRQLADAGGVTPEARRAALQQAYERYPKRQREQMAVLDYIMGNTDRHVENFRTDRHGGIVAYDNSLSFPEAPDPQSGIRSPFVKQFHHVELSADTLARARAVDPDHLRAAWTDAGLGEKAIEGALARWREICDHGAITGAAWPGEINDVVVNPSTAALPLGRLESSRR
jgi:hypothetical protein